MRSGADLGGPGLLLGILVGSWEAFKLSWDALGLSWAALGRSWAALGRSWAALGDLMGALGLLWMVLGRQVGAKMEPKRRNIDPKTRQNRGQDGPS